jgi:serine/threonine-protein kinase
LSASIADPALALDLPGAATWPTDRYRDLAAETVAVLGSPSAKPEELAVRWSTGLGKPLGRIVAGAVALLVSSRAERSFSNTPPARIGSYRMVDRLGRGAQGEAWLVEHERTGRRFVIKLLPQHVLFSRTPEQRAELERALAREGDILKSIYHPNVANFVDYGLFGERPYLVLEYLVGCDLGEYCDVKPLSIAELKPIVADVAAGLAAIAGFGLVHGDLKPGNIFLRLALPADDRRFEPARDRDPAVTAVLGAVVIDLGVARSLPAGELANDVSGTPGYLAPEQAQGKAHPKTDVYALAATVYRALSGRTFFAHMEGIAARLFAHASRQPFDDPATLAALPAGTPAALLALLREATAMDPLVRPDPAVFARRFQEL